MAIIPTPDQDNIVRADLDHMITCAAQGHPEPAFTWAVEGDNTIYTGNRLRVLAHMVNILYIYISLIY